ncbi:hypothetical protein AMTR_s00062p00030200 [Amborella trichopoda]|uniref:Uncharacterized protein n=1 Tax=Amborella trichopoda TaxID=13333 RepID=U5DBF5_AMBTC|nr:hypothetical protein AMTR_s00062p00030200 [Amborella trichopoda]
MPSPQGWQWTRWLGPVCPGLAQPVKDQRQALTWPGLALAPSIASPSPACGTIEQNLGGSSVGNSHGIRGLIRDYLGNMFDIFLRTMWLNETKISSCLRVFWK